MTNVDLLKQDVFAIIDKKQADNILREQDAEFLKKLIDHAETENEIRQIQRLGVVARQTGLVFPAKIGREEMTDTLHILKRNDDLSFSQGGIENTLIIGENYHALQNLDIQYHGQVDVIYLDPPYGKDYMGEYAKTNYTNGVTRDELLSMLYVRFQIAKGLLSDDGMIFVSIDDKNQAYVKCLMDEIFEPANYIQTYTWESSFRPDNSSPLIRPNAEYVLCYAKNKTKYTHFKKYSSSTAGMASLSKGKETVKTLTFPANIVKTTLPDGHYDKGQYSDKGWILENDIDVINGLIITPLMVTGHSYWATDSKIQSEIQNGTELWIKSTKFIPYVKKAGSGMVVPTTILPRDNISDYDTSKQELASIVGDLQFKNPKPTSLVKFLISCVDNPDAVVLDFFAGSGTTGHAMLALNEEDKGNRKFILCTNNEVTDSNPNGIALDVTTKRLKRIMTGSCYDGSTDFEWIKKNTAYGNSLIVYDIVDVDPCEQGDGNLIDAIHEEDYGMLKMNPADKADWIYRNFQKCLKGEKHD